MIKVGASGAFATALDVATLIILVELVRVHVTAAAFLAAIAGGITNFLVNKFWAFRDFSRVDVRQITSYAAVSLVTASFVAAAVHLFAVMIGWPYLVAKGLAAVTVFLGWSYPAQARFVFPASQRAPRRAA
jgi:putative flippase GtrA